MQVEHSYSCRIVNDFEATPASSLLNSILYLMLTASFNLFLRAGSFGTFLVDRVSLHDTATQRVSSNVQTIQPMHCIWLTGGYSKAHRTFNLVMEHENSDVWWSKDGATWTQVTELYGRLSTRDRKWRCKGWRICCTMVQSDMATTLNVIDY